MSTATHRMGADAYDHFRDQIAAQGVEEESLALLDETAMQFLDENERIREDGDVFTVRMLDGDGYQTMTILGLGKA